MPFRFVCSQCGALLLVEESPRLYESNERAKKGGYMDHVIKKIGGRCPRCGKPLQIPPVNVEVSALKRERRARVRIHGGL